MPMERVGRADWITKTEFHSRLERWYRDTAEPIIGDPGAQRWTAWIWVRDGHQLTKVNADTTRAGVAEYLALVRQWSDAIEWTVTESSQGKFTKVVFGPDQLAVKGFHVYADPRTLPRRLLRHPPQHPY